LVAGIASDYYGRRKVLMASTTMGVISMIILGLGSTPRDIIIAISLYGLAQGMTSPTLFAWATDLSDETHKGRGISSLYIFMEMGIGIGAFASGFIYGNDPANFSFTFFICGALGVIAFLYLIFNKTKDRMRATHQEDEMIEDAKQNPLV
jgi:MFS family permease